MLIELYNLHQDIWADTTPVDVDKDYSHWTDVWLGDAYESFDAAPHVEAFASAVAHKVGRVGFSRWEKEELLDHVRGLGYGLPRSIDEAALNRDIYNTLKAASKK